MKLVNDLGPYIDGYIISNVLIKNNRVNGYSCEFAGDELVLHKLSNTPGDFFFHVNIFSEQSSPVAEYEAIDPMDRTSYEERVSRTTRWLQEFQTKILFVDQLLELLASNDESSYSYSNVDVKSYCVGKLSQAEFTIWIGSGPATRGDHLEKIVMSSTSSVS